MYVYIRTAKNNFLTIYLKLKYKIKHFIKIGLQKVFDIHDKIKSNFILTSKAQWRRLEFDLVE